MTGKHRDLVEWIANDPAVRARVEAGLADDPVIQEGRRRYAEAAQPILEQIQPLVPDLDLINHQLAGIGDLYRIHVFFLDAQGNEISRRPIDYRAVVPVLLDWLPRVRHAHVAEEIVIALQKPFAKKQAHREMLRLFRDPPRVSHPLRPENAEFFREQLRWRIGEALGKFAGPAVAAEMVELALDRSYGAARTQIVNPGLAKTKDPRVPGILLELLADPTVAPAAAQGLGRLRHAPARGHLEKALHGPDENVRRQAKQALKRLI
ncbi:MULTISPECIES: HEAT repeat domain-containing protein [unclassified Crossiella]|uniref:HEAT repeat domain-containing protein n=1 Tax=unclassified Crossiella TaxID=2620835 RepID=UPI001FFEBBE2|nr:MULTISPECIES: HEAT repeat domain-containing protein [unclassified Crossiella]MCK2240647.1 hypothetical protein [Crossiella sp. S99.2]MCK2252902.1 hypothetical protein [Crossiella sp. S99.1]